jgi:hypothetical protein
MRVPVGALPVTGRVMMLMTVAASVWNSAPGLVMTSMRATVLAGIDCRAVARLAPLSAADGLPSISTWTEAPRTLTLPLLSTVTEGRVVSTSETLPVWACGLFFRS